LLCSACLLNGLMFNKENNGCNFKSAGFNMIFAFWIAVPELVLRCGFLSFWNTERWLPARRLILLIAPAVAYAVYFTYSSTYWPQMTPQCYEPYPSLGLVVFVISMVCILPQAFLAICVTIFLVIFFPCIIYQVITAICNERERSQLKERVINGIKKMEYDEVKFSECQKDCCICMFEFD
jgi:hypothetical protein